MHSQRRRMQLTGNMRWCSWGHWGTLLPLWQKKVRFWACMINCSVVIYNITCEAHYEFADVLQAAESQVGNIPLVFVAVLVWGVDVCDPRSSNQRDAFVTRTFGHKQHGDLVRFDVSHPEKHQLEHSGQTGETRRAGRFFYLQKSRPEGEGVLLRVDDVSIFASLAVLLLVVHLWVLGVLWASRVGVVPATNQKQTSCPTADSLGQMRPLKHYRFTKI